MQEFLDMKTPRRTGRMLLRYVTFAFLCVSMSEGSTRTHNAQPAFPAFAGPLDHFNFEATLLEQRAGQVSSVRHLRTFAPLRTGVSGHSRDLFHQELYQIASQSGIYGKTNSLSENRGTTN